MGDEIAFEMAEFPIPTFKARDLDLRSGHTAYRHASLIDLYLGYIPNFIEIDETFYERTGGRTFENPFIWSTRRSRPKNGN